MEQISLWFRGILVGAGGLFGYVWGEWTMLMQVLTAMIVIDYITGLLASGVEGKLSSKVGFKGIIKKVTIFVFVAVGHFLDMAIGEGSVIQDAIIFFYIGNELISLLENGGRIGLPIPSVLQRAVEVLKNKSDGGGK